jgi:hypothetical protein
MAANECTAGRRFDVSERPDSLPDHVRTKLPPGDPLYLAPGDTVAGRRASILAQSATNPATGTPEAVLKPTKADAQAEKELQRLCEQDLTRHGVEFLHMREARGNKAGWPDIVFCVVGWPVAVELKASGGRLSPEQDECLERMRLDGWRVAVVWSWDEWWALLSGLTGGRWAMGKEWRDER